MISKETSLSSAENAPFNAQSNLLVTRKDFYDQVKSRFLQQSAEYLGSTLSYREIETLLDQKSYVRN